MNCKSDEYAKILYIEDNFLNVMLLKEIINVNLGYEFKSASSAEDGIQMALAGRPDLILMDIHLPGMDGVSAFHELKKNDVTRGIPVIAISASTGAAEMEKYLQEGFVRYLTKPVNVAALIEIIQEHI